MMPQRATGLERAPITGQWPYWLHVSAGFMLGAVALAWHNSFSGNFLYDDVPAVMQNLSIRHLGSAFSAGRTDLTVSGRPLGNFSLAINYALDGTRVQGYHALNLLIHLLAGATMFGIVRKTLARAPLADRFSGAAPWLALTVAVLWLVHPLQTESVTYTIQRVESLMGLFYLLTLYCFIRGAESSHPAKWHACAVVACVAGMASKEVMVSAPLMVLIYDRTFFASSFREALGRRSWLYAGLAASWLPLAYWISSGGLRGGTAGFGGPVTWSEYALLQCPAIVHYLRLSFWPQPLVFDYGIMAAPPFVAIVLPALLLLALAAGTLIGLRRRTPAGCLGAWFGLILAPSSSFVPVGTESMAEHRMYLPLAAIVMLSVLGLHRLLGLRLLPLYAVLAIGLGWITSERNNDYRSELAIWTDTVAKQPGNARARNNLGTIWLGRGDLVEAERCFAEAVRLQPAYASAHYNLGIVAGRSGRDGDALGHFLAAIQLEDDFVDARINAGNALLKLGRIPDAVRQYDAALHLQPESADLHYDLGLALDRLDRPDDAIREYESALRLRPTYAWAHYNLGIVQTRTGREADALGHFLAAARLDDGFVDAHINAGNALLKLGRASEAVQHYEAALHGRPESPDLHYNLGLALSRLDRLDDAIREYEAALRLDPRRPQVRLDLAEAETRKGDVVAGERNYREVIRLQPDLAAAHLGLGDLLVRTNRLPTAIEEYQKTLQSEPGNLHARFILGNALLIVGRIDEAITQYEEILRVRPDEPDVIGNLQQARAMKQSSRRNP